MASDKRVQVTLECQECKRRNYITTKSKVNSRERIELKKFCRWCRNHVDHKETRCPRFVPWCITELVGRASGSPLRDVWAPLVALGRTAPRFRPRVGGRDTGQWLNW